MSVRHIQNFNAFQRQLDGAGAKLVVVDFYATWCGPCKIISPVVEALALTMHNIVFLKVDVDECEDIAEYYNVQSMPTFILIKNRCEVSKMSGANANRLQNLIQKNM